MSDSGGAVRRLVYILFLISSIFSILSTVLSIIDKEEIDKYIIIDIVLGSTLILLLAFGVIFVNESVMEPFLYVTIVIWMANNVMSFFTYKNPNKKDFLGVCIFLRVIRIISVFLCMGMITVKIEERY